MTELGVSFAIDDAMALAVEAHRGQCDKGRPALPYVTHPLRVMSAFDEPALQMIAVLHDSIEDSRSNPQPVTADVMTQRGVPQRVIDAVICLTKNEGEDLLLYWARVKSNPDALQVKLVDVADNSDPARLALLQPEKAERLRAKYERALKFLNS